MLHLKYLLRPLTKRMDQSKLFELLQRWVPTLLIISQTLRRIPLIARALKRIIPVADYTDGFPLSDKQFKE
jgi:hypothetical protein